VINQTASATVASTDYNEIATFARLSRPSQANTLPQVKLHGHHFYVSLYVRKVHDQSGGKQREGRAADYPQSQVVGRLLLAAKEIGKFHC
jgi:hypothetical protein